MCPCHVHLVEPKRDWPVVISQVQNANGLCELCALHCVILSSIVLLVLLSDPEEELTTDGIEDTRDVTVSCSHVLVFGCYSGIATQVCHPSFEVTRWCLVTS